ncbi:MAG TPA: 50S ribosomal protein L11 methyltransferase [Bacteriovoracaceae bacterium]|nr:50S ribosomal protein L11 methyltransferase [Bacteriovoracaceae bacterium]
MDKFWVVTLFHFQPTEAERSKIEKTAFENFRSLGIEEYSLNEAEVDSLLGERSYSGGDLPAEVLEEVEATVLGRPGNYRYFFDSEETARAFKQAVSAFALCECQSEEKTVEDWNAEWKKHYSPIRVNDQLEIIPSWLGNHPSTSTHRILINPGMGFGTGSHETTYLCLKLFTENISSTLVSTVLDFGSGSGILGLTALKFFPESRVDFYDIDLEANKNCYQNAEINGLSNSAFRLLLPDYRSELLEKYDVVFANILESILFQEKVPLIAHIKNGGLLILSGLLRHQVPGIITAYSESGVTLKSQVEKGDWAALLFYKALA